MRLSCANNIRQRSLTPGVKLIGPALVLLICCLSEVSAATRWSSKLDGRVRFYQTTEVGVLIAGTEKSLYARDGESGDV
jgi:hypothetical protein